MTYVFAQIDATNPYGKIPSCSVIVCNTDEAEQLIILKNAMSLRLIPQAQLTRQYMNSLPQGKTPDETSKPKILL